MAVDLNNYISAGYFFVKPIARPDDVSPLVPNMPLTASSCFTDIAPDDWADFGYNYSEEERAVEARKFGIPSTVVSLRNALASSTGRPIDRQAVRAKL